MVHSARYNSDESKIVSAGIDKTMKIWDVSDNYSEIISYTYSVFVLDALFTPNDDLVMSSDFGGEIRVYYGK